VYKSLHETGSAYLADEISHSSDFESRRRLRSTSSLNLFVGIDYQHMVIVRFLSLVLVSGTVFHLTSNLRNIYGERARLLKVYGLVCADRHVQT